MTKIEILQAIKARRCEMGMTQQEVADAVGLLRQSYERVENGRSSPTVTTIEAICRVLHLDLIVKSSQ